MKTFKSLFVAFICMMVSNVALADDRPIPVEQLPASAKTFVTKNFQGKILYLIYLLSLKFRWSIC